MREYIVKDFLKARLVNQVNGGIQRLQKGISDGDLQLIQEEVKEYLVLEEKAYEILKARPEGHGMETEGEAKEILKAGAMEGIKWWGLYGEMNTLAMRLLCKVKELRESNHQLAEEVGAHRRHCLPRI